MAVFLKFLKEKEKTMKILIFDEIITPQRSHLKKKTKI